MSKENGFLQHRRGIWEHVRDGRMTLQDVAVHQYIAAQADTRTGVWSGSAGALAGELCLSPRIARRFLERLSRGDYIRRFPCPGKHVCYPILIHKFEPTNGEHKGEQLDAINSISPIDLRYVPVEIGELEGEQRGEHKGEHLSPQKRIKNREGRREKKEGAPASPSLSFTGQHLSVGTNQDAILGEAFPWIDRSSEYRKADSWLEANPDRRPKKTNRFLHNWFTRITQPKGGGNAKDINAAITTTMQGAFNSGITH
jgi:hypothetical protein